MHYKYTNHEPLPSVFLIIIVTTFSVLRVAMQMLDPSTTLLIAAIKPCPVVEGLYEPVQNYINT